jgi:pimeloyl-ACP methyl ester carboxylesterase
MEVAVATYVLVHGTGSGGWLWDPVADLLRAAGHEVQAPTLVGVGERASEGGPDTNLTTHVQQIVSLVQDQAVPRVILVGFSYSGLVVEGVAATIPDRIAQLVLIDALLVPKGKCGFDAFPAEAAEHMRAAARDQGEGWKLPPMPLELVGGIGSVEPGMSFADIERTLLERRGTHPIGSYEEPVTWDAASLPGVSRRYVICTDKPSPLRERLAARVRELRDLGCSVDDLPTGHFPMRTVPKALTALLLSSAPSTPSDND